MKGLAERLRWMPAQAALFATILAATPAFSQANVTVEAWRLSSDSVGCRSNDDLNKIGSLIASDDREAAMTLYFRLRDSGACRMVLEGPVFIETASILGNSCVRKKGAPDCYFVFRSKIQKAS